MNKNKLALLLVILLAIFLRVYLLDKVPPSLFSDEVDLGYQAYSISETGSDYYGNFLPVHIQSLADFRTPLYIYAAVPFVKLFGLNEWAVRLPAAIFGIVSVVGIYFLVRKLGFGYWICIISSFLMAISPWHLHFSRAGFEATLMIALLIWGIYFFLEGLKRQKFLVVSVILFGLSLYSYNTIKLFLPLFLFILTLIYKKEIFKLPFNFKLSLFALVLLITLPLFKDTLSGQSGYRFSYISIFADPTVADEIDVLRGVDSPQTTLISKISHNKIRSHLDAFTRNYFSAFSTNFLFLDGDRIGRHSVGKMGEFYLVEVLTLILGIFWLIKKAAREIKILIISWVLLAPIPAALTVEGATHASRLFLMLPPLVILSAAGFYELINLTLKRGYFRKFLFLLFLSLFAFNIYNYFHQYYVHHAKEQERLWHFGFKQAILKTETIKNDYDKVIFTPTTEPPLIFILFWTSFNPETFQKQGLEYVSLPEFGDKIPKLGKYYFAGIDSKIELENLNFIIPEKTLLVVNRKDISLDLRVEGIPGLKVVDIIEYPSGEIAFYLLTHE